MRVGPFGEVAEEVVGVVFGGEETAFVLIGLVCFSGTVSGKVRW